MSQTGDYQGLGLPSGRIGAMFRAALVTRRGSCAGRDGVCWRSWGQFRTGRGKRGPAAVAPAPHRSTTALAFLLAAHLRVTQREKLSHTPTSCRTTRAFMSPF